MIKSVQQIKNEKALKTAFGALCYLFFIGFALWQLFWWYQNPELTKMQVFQEWWLYDIAATIIFLFGYKISGNVTVNRYGD